MDIRIDSLILEVTRRCNMCCPHCLRGDAENMDADIDLIPQIFEGITEVGTLTFSGGEPSLNTKYIMAVVDYVIEHGVRINGCFVATNAKVYSQDLVDCVRRLWEASFRRQKTMCSAAKWLRANSDECELDEFAIAVLTMKRSQLKTWCAICVAVFSVTPKLMMAALLSAVAVVKIFLTPMPVIFATFTLKPMIAIC